MSSRYKTPTSSPDKPSGNPPGIPFDKEPPQPNPLPRKLLLGSLEILSPNQHPKQLPKQLHLANPPPFQKKDFIVLINKRDPFPKHLKVAFLKDFTQKDILALVEISAKLQLLKICQDCYHSMGAMVSSMNRNWGILYVAKQLGAIIWTFHRFTKELKKAKTKEIVAHAAKIGELTKPQKKTGQRPQDFIKLDPKKILKQTCPQCGRFNTTELQSAKEIEQINKQLIQTQMLHWENKSTAVKLKTRKPRKKPTQERQIACYCHNVHCMLETSRGVCYCFCGYVKDGKDLPMDQTDTACKCERLAIASEIYPLKEPDEEKAAVGGVSVFLSYVEGKIDSHINEQYVTNPFATKASHLQNAHATTFLDIISDPVLGSARDGKTINQLRDEKRGVKSKPSSDSRFHCNKLSLAPMDPACFLFKWTTKKDKTPAFVWSVCWLAIKKADFQMNSQDTQDILDFVGPKLAYNDDLEVTVNMKVRVSDHGESGKEVTKSLSSAVKWCKQVQVHKQQKAQKEDD
eukprot:jgi/Psemu1/1491/gm1.1491_g